ncbi:Thiaminase II [Gottschalkia acidurici 9a]|uniref:Aminopyrimidine aminohydrolase n=1 Tax=Gottschalkia acidurici (strain ATCC 7906 / DSM 604 / BCRC 14475 / CIP 104303 / KCTC 5404 / NCIMB 10678 / 9a) TaxID=1128398 RepID=K0AZU5_GOTA9|nr:thiaminase II [Gottschalkia acidurici]AFS78799.1 Thiaminase II [Gottschalkia acidurici 9a]
MKFSERLFKSAEGIFNSYYEHPFVKGIGEGTLDVDKFKFYMVQDYLYLLDYAKIFALGIIKSDDEEVMRGFAKAAEGILDGEMKIHKSYMKRLGITDDEVKNSKRSLTNLSYTHYMLTESHNGSLAEVAIAVLSCAWTYWEIGKKLAQIPNSTEHEFYGEWVRGYSSEEFGNSAIWNIDLVNKLAQSKSEEELNKLEEIFINTCKFEYMFWDMAYNKEM